MKVAKLLATTIFQCSVALLLDAVYSPMLDSTLTLDMFEIDVYPVCLKLLVWIQTPSFPVF